MSTTHLMTLAEYVEQTGTTPEDLAAKSGLSANNIRRYIRGARVPRMTGGPDSEMAKLIRACDGRITADSFLCLQSRVA